MLSLLPVSMEPPPPPPLPRVSALPTSPPPSTPASPSQSLEGGARKRKFQVSSGTEPTHLDAAASSGALSSQSATAVDSSWAGDEPPLSSSLMLLSAAVRSSTASTASSSPSPQPLSATSVLHSPHPVHHSRTIDEPTDSQATSNAASSTSSQPTAASPVQPPIQLLPATVAPKNAPQLATTTAAMLYAPSASSPTVHAPLPSSPLSPATSQSQPWSQSGAFTGSPSFTIRSHPASAFTPTHSSPRSAAAIHRPVAIPMLPSPPPPPGVPPATITTLMPVMPYARVEPAVDAHFAVSDGDLLLGRYRVVRLLGRGTFSQVVQCRDVQAERQGLVEEDASRIAATGRRSTDVAIKIVRAVERYRVAAEREARLLQAIDHARRALSAAARPPYATDGCVSLLGSFMLGGHLCLVFPVLGLSLYDFLRLNRFRPLFPAHIRHIGYQLLQTCAFLHDDCGIIHADIKPENVLLVDSSFQTIHLASMPINVPLATAVRLIDFGTAVQRSSDRPALVVSRSYRAVEVVLGVGWGEGVDVWAVGCVLMELYTGQRLFSVGQGGDEAHVRQMQQLLGAVPDSLSQLPRIYPPSSPQSLASSPVVQAGGGLALSGLMLRDRIVAGDVKFGDLIERMLTFDPRQRITARQALQHPYFMDND